MMKHRRLTILLSAAMLVMPSLITYASSKVSISPVTTLETLSSIPDDNFLESESTEPGTVNNLPDKKPVIESRLEMAVSTPVNKKLPDKLLSTPVNAQITGNNDVNDQTTGESSTQTEDDIANTFSDEELAQLRQYFLKAEQALEQKNIKRFQRYSKLLKEYSLYPYLQYQYLSRRLGNTNEIEKFISEFKSSRYTAKLKNRWLKYLGKKHQWKTYLKYYTESSNTSLQCYYHRAQFVTGDKEASLKGAARLWSVGYSQPKVCDPLFAQLKRSELFTAGLKWTRFEAAIKNSKTSLAKYIRKQMPTKDQKTAQLWLNLHRNPAKYMPSLLKQKTSSHAPEMFSHAIYRLSRKDIDRAVELWDKHHNQFNLSSETTAKIERRLAFKLAWERNENAYERFTRIKQHDASSRTWRVRVALLEQNWGNVLEALNALNEKEKSDERWQYWYARTYQELGELEKAESLLTNLSFNRSFYGYMAADRVNSLYHLSNNPIDISMQEIDALKARREFRVAHELRVLDRKLEAKLQWWHAVKSLNTHELITASKLAQRWQWDEIAIFTIAKAKHWDDIDVRFPLRYADKILENSAKNELNPAILFGLVRRESAFNEKAHSPAGARGLMQIMPSTGRQIARDFKERWHGSNSLYQPVTNLKYGSYYYTKLLKQFDGNYALALAAYNAGPQRVKKWLPENDATLPADIWIETIPFHETREYVVNVLAYALIYQQRAQLDELSMHDLARDVTSYEIIKQKI